MYSGGRSKTISYQYNEEKIFLTTDTWHGLPVIYSGEAMPYSKKGPLCPHCHVDSNGEADDFG